MADAAHGRQPRAWRRAAGPALATVLLAASVATRPAAAAEWHVDGEAEPQVEFTSSVVGVTFTGNTDRVDGYLYWEGEDLFERRGQVYFEVDLGSLDTGVGKRDRDMRQVLETDRWPRASYRAQVEQVQADSAGSGYRVLTRGTFALHGVERQMEIAGTVRAAGAALVVESTFTVRLADHHIEAPSLVAFVKVSDEVSVHVQMHMKPAEEEDE